MCKSNGSSTKTRLCDDSTTLSTYDLIKASIESLQAPLREIHLITHRTPRRGGSSQSWDVAHVLDLTQERAKRILAAGAGT